MFAVDVLGNILLPMANKNGLPFDLAYASQTISFLTSVVLDKHLRIEISEINNASISSRYNLCNEIKKNTLIHTGKVSNCSIRINNDNMSNS